MIIQDTNTNKSDVQPSLSTPSPPSFQNFYDQISLHRQSCDLSSTDRLVYVIPPSSPSSPTEKNTNDDGEERTKDDSSQSIIVIERSHVGRPQPTDVRPWSTNIFGCFTDLTSCLQTVVCPCKTMGQVNEILSEGNTPWWEGAMSYCVSHFLCCSCVFYSWHIRTKMRKEYKLEGNACLDGMVSCCFSCCALCQEYRELNQQGFDPSLGWHENIQRQKHAVAIYRITPPSVEENMAR